MFARYQRLLARTRCAVLVGQFLRSDLELRHRGGEVFVFQFLRRNTRVLFDLLRLARAHLVSPERDHPTDECDAPPGDSPPSTTGHSP